LTSERIAKAQQAEARADCGHRLRPRRTCRPAIDGGLTVAEVTYSNSISVAEHVVMMILALVRNYIPSYQWVIDGGWNIADCVSRSYDLEGMQVGTVAAGRIGSAVLRRLEPFEVGLHYNPTATACRTTSSGSSARPSTRASSPLVEVCDVVTINAPLHPETENPVRRAAAREDEARRVPDQHGARQDLRPRRRRAGMRELGSSPGYAGDVWFPSRRRGITRGARWPHHGMTPHVSGTSLSAQSRYAAGAREILECYFDGRPIRGGST